MGESTNEVEVADDSMYSSERVHALEEKVRELNRIVQQVAGGAGDAPPRHSQRGDGKRIQTIALLYKLPNFVGEQEEKVRQLGLN